MSYLVLARKYRPRTFTEVVGQETAMRTLQGAIAEQRVGHAYLFTGPRGTGKTTTARILAKALLCVRGPTSEPCLECEHCLDVESGTHVDVVEMDAASNRGIEHARELRERVAYAPMRARYKVYIVDEVHQLTKEAFNALLKTLEEPPPHVKFLFATTELDKVLETVRSRCQIVRLSLIPEARIAAHLDAVLARENVVPEPGVTAELAKLARGSLRDGLSITDQLLALVGDRPKLEDVARVAPQGGPERIDALLAKVEQGDRAGMLEALAKVEGGEGDLCDALLAHLRTALLCHLCPADAQLFEADDALRRKLAERAKRLGPDKLQTWLEELLHARERIALIPQQARIVLEVTLLDLCRGEGALSIAAIEERLLALEQRLGAPGRAGAGAPAPSAAPPPRPLSSQASVAPPPPGPAPARAATPANRPESGARTDTFVPVPPPSRSAGPPAGFSVAGSTTATWARLLDELEGPAPELASLLRRRGRLADLREESAAILVPRATEAERRLACAESSVELCRDSLSRILARAIRVSVDAQRPSEPGAGDDFTRGVAELFSGQIEDIDR